MSKGRVHPYDAVPLSQVYQPYAQWVMEGAAAILKDRDLCEFIHLDNQ